VPLNYQNNFKMSKSENRVAGYAIVDLFFWLHNVDIGKGTNSAAERLNPAQDSRRRSGNSYFG
jgi:hypothetical protein